MPDFLLKLKKMILGIAIYKKVGYLKENEAVMLKIICFHTSVFFRTKMFHSNVGLLWDIFFYTEK